MLRTLLLAGTAASAVAAFAAPALATTITIDDAQTTRLRNDDDDLKLTITPQGSVIVPNNDALDLRGNRQTVVNEGVVRGEGDNNALRARGSDLTVDNAGVFEGTDRGIRLSGGDGGFTLYNRETGEILSRRQAVRLDNDELLAGNRFENWGLIESTEGRAIQSRGPGNVVINHETGRMFGGEEVIEGRMDFTVENHGLIAIRGLEWDPETRTWTDSGATPDEDGVQFASGTVHNHGVILATDDGVDIDEGVVHNHATGVIISTAPDNIRGSAGIDIDEVLQDPGGPRDGEIPGKVTVVNEGYIEGPTGIAADLDAVQPIEIRNFGTLIGRGGNAIDLAPNQGDTLIELSGGSQVFGDILFGAGGNNTLAMGPFDDGAGIFSKVSAREGGTFEVVFGDGFTLSDILAYRLVADLFEMDLRAGSGRFRFNALGAAGFTLKGERFASADFATFLGDNGVAPIPLPATLPLLVAGFGGLALFRRRRAA